MLTAGNCLIFRRCEDLRNMMEDMDRYQGETIWREWFDNCYKTIKEQGVVYVLVQKYSFVRSKDEPYNAERYIEVISRKNNKRW